MFDQIIGNDPLKSVLRRFLTTRRVPNALLFSGENGIGKKRFALELARSVICLSPINAEACEKCAACRRTAKFNFPKADDRDAFKRVIFSEHPDLGTIVPYNKNILVDAIRDVEAEANFRPFEAAARFFIIDDADKMNDSAANALLKTLEEPPAASYIFLVTSRLDALLPTIRSRCQTLRFALVAAAEIEKHLAHDKNFPAADIALAAKLAGGKPGIALASDLEKFRRNRDAMLEVLTAILILKDRAALLRHAEEMNDAKNKDDFETRLDILQTLIHDVWAIRQNAAAEIVVNTDVIGDLRKFAEKSETRRLSEWLQEIENLRGKLAVNINRKIAADALLMAMAQ